MDRQGVSFKMGQRLKDLREGRDLSHVDLIKQLSEKYGISISRDSLMAYEIADQTRAKASKLPNLGMRVEYIYCLADFFGVSADYLLGRTDIKSADTDLQGVCGYTGLGQAAAEHLHRTAVDDNVPNMVIAFLNSFLGGHPRIEEFAVSAWRAAMTQAINWMDIDNGVFLDDIQEIPEDEQRQIENGTLTKREQRERATNRRIIEQFKSGRSKKHTVEVSAGDISMLYEDLAESCLSDALEDAIIDAVHSLGVHYE